MWAPIRVCKSSEIVQIKWELYKGFYFIIGVVARKLDSKVGGALEVLDNMFRGFDAGGIWNCTAGQ